MYLKGATAWTYLGLVLEKLWLALGQSSMHDWAWETDLSLCRASLRVLTIKSLLMSGCG